MAMVIGRRLASGSLGFPTALVDGGTSEAVNSDEKSLDMTIDRILCYDPVSS